MRLSVLERIARASGGVSPPQATVADLRKEVLWHLEWILNTRRGDRDLPESLVGTALAYGLPDFKVNAVDEDRVRDRLADLLSLAVKDFEPRLTEVSIRVEPGLGKLLRLKVTLTAMLRVDPMPEPFEVETLLDLSTHEFILPK
ncbi:MAG: type VI secretion system baseplate subunit TssE [Isosphaeraceae bacterium]